MAKYSRRNNKISILLIDKNLDDFLLLQKIIQRTTFSRSSLACAPSVREGLEMMSRSRIDLIIINLHVSENQGIESVIQIHDKNAAVPLLVIGDLPDDDQLIVDAISLGAQDYVAKTELNAHILEKSIIYALERQLIQDGLRELSMTDELTGLYNRRGFLKLAEQQISMATRHKKGFLLYMIDINFFKKINDTYGHPAGDQAILDLTDCLKQAFRQHDIIARIGGDEFAVIAVNAENDVEDILKEHLLEKISTVNNSGSRPYKISLSIGSSHYHALAQRSLDDLIEDADKKLYIKKKEAHTATE
ncbi:MAG: diguanylate cyclase [Chlamydiales bacterium]